MMIALNSAPRMYVTAALISALPGVVELQQIIRGERADDKPVTCVITLVTSACASLSSVSPSLQHLLTQVRGRLARAAMCTRHCRWRGLCCSDDTLV